MSYILDALKKSQQERQQGTNPDVQSLHQSITPAEPNRMPVFLVVGLLIAIIVLLLGYQWLSHSPQKVSVTTNEENAPAIQKEAASQPMPAAQGSTQQDLIVPPPVAEKPAISNTVVELWELPDPVQAEIPALTFSFHVFSSNPERRTIIINGRRLKEGGQVAEQLRLLEITESGVILNWKNSHQFYIPVVESW